MLGIRPGVARVTGIAGVLAAAALLAGCGKVQASSAAPPCLSARPSPASATPPVGSCAEAQAYARQLLAGLVLPPGAQPTRLAPAPQPLPSTLAAPVSVPSAGTERRYLAAQPMSAVASFLAAHAPRGMSPSASTGKETGPHGTILAERVNWIAPAPPSGIQSAELDIMVTPRSSRSALIDVFDIVYWFPPRSAAEHIDARRYQRVTVLATVSGPVPRTTTRPFTSAQVIGRLAGYLNGLPASTGTSRCPAVWVASQLTFTGAGVPDVTVWAGQCFGDVITVGGAVQPSLYDQNHLATITEQLLHVTPPKS
jgi:hypothetical protein